MPPIESNPLTGQPAGVGNRYSVLFVCTHNVLRSPLAEALFQKVLQDSDPNWKTWKVGSAGTWVEKTDRPISIYRSVLAQRGIPYVPHMPIMITPAIIDTYRLILTMEKGHKEALQIENPAHTRKIYLLSEMVGLSVSIPDPANEHRPDYEQLANLLETWLQQGLTMIRALAVETSSDVLSSNDLTN
jgi:protein-tyrosine phosphatase